MQLTLHVTRRPPHDAWHSVQTISIRSVKMRRALSELSREARVHGREDFGHT